MERVRVLSSLWEGLNDEEAKLVAETLCEFVLDGKAVLVAVDELVADCVRCVRLDDNDSDPDKLLLGVSSAENDLVCESVVVVLVRERVCT